MLGVTRSFRRYYCRECTWY